jgi:hypothetical protein
LAWHARSKLVIRGGLAVNTVDVKFPSLRSQFDEYVGQVNLQRAPGDPSQLFQISNGPGSFSLPVRNNSTAGFVGTNYSGRNIDLWDPNLRNPYVLNWQSSIQYQVSENYLVEGSYRGSAGIGLLERWNLNTFPVDFGKGNPAPEPGAGRVAELPAIPELRQHQRPVNFRTLHLPRRHHQGGQAYVE